MKFQTAAIVILAISLSAPLLSAQEALSQTQQNAEQKTTPVPVRSVVLFSPSNSRISFVGIHVGDDPKPRLGGFSQFQGYAVVDPSNNKLTSMVLDINVDSVWTQFEKLTGHLKNSDFFDTEKFPTAKFVSSEIKSGENGKCEITGNLTLHGQTKAVTFSANYRLAKEGFVLSGKFKLDRSRFGMDQMLSGVEKLVDVEISIGQPTKASAAKPGNGSDSKKKQAKVDGSSKLREVSINLPNMT